MKTINDSFFRYCVFYSSEANKQFIDDYCTIHNKVFFSQFDEAAFCRKFLDDIYGDSIHVIVYHKDKPCAIRSLWRNDISMKVSYQACDTAVLPFARGKGVFWNMTSMAINYISIKNYLIYNFPNTNSRNLYLKRGWEVLDTYYITPLITNSGYDNNSDSAIPDDYCDWYLEGKKNFFVHKFYDHYYLVRKKHSFIYVIIGKISKKEYESSKYKRSGFGLLFFRTTKKTFMKLHPLFVLALSGDGNCKIDSWRMDAV